MQIYLFGAVWCKECLIMRPLWRNIKLEFPQLKTKYFEFDDADNKDYCRTFGIVDVPTAIFIDENGRELERVIGIAHKDNIIDLIKKYQNL